MLTEERLDTNSILRRTRQSQRLYEQSQQEETQREDERIRSLIQAEEEQWQEQLEIEENNLRKRIEEEIMEQNKINRSNPKMPETRAETISNDYSAIDHISVSQCFTGGLYIQHIKEIPMDYRRDWTKIMSIIIQNVLEKKKMEMSYSCNKR